MTETLLDEFRHQVESWTLIPADGGRYEVVINGDLIYSKLRTGRHTDNNEIRKLIQEYIDTH